MKSIVTASEPASIDLTVLATVKAELGITSNDENDNIARWITQASRIAASYCKREFARQTVTETFWPDHGFWPYRTENAGNLYLSRKPIVSITSVTIDGGVVADTTYRLDAENGVLHALSGAVYPYHFAVAEAIVVVYVAGYDLLGSLPHDIERAVIMMVSDMRQDATRDPNLKSKSIDGVSSYEWWIPGDSKTMLPVEVSGLLDPYVKRWGWMA